MIKIYDEISNELKEQSYDDIIENLLSNTNSNYISGKEAVDIIKKEFFNQKELEEAEIITLKHVKIPVGRKQTKYTEIVYQH